MGLYWGRSVSAPGQRVSHLMGAPCGFRILKATMSRNCELATAPSLEHSPREYIHTLWPLTVRTSGQRTGEATRRLSCKVKIVSTGVEVTAAFGSVLSLPGYFIMPPGAVVDPTLLRRLLTRSSSTFLTQVIE